MVTPVSDFGSNAEENLLYVATVIGRGLKQRVFTAIYTGKRRVKTVDDIAKATKLSRKAVLNVGKALIDHRVVRPAKVSNQTAYEKVDTFHRNKAKILALANSKAKRDALVTKRNPKGGTKPVTVKVSLRRARATAVTIDDIDSFRKAWSVRTAEDLPRTVSETAFKEGVKAILGELGRFKDWPGETNDLYSTRVRVAGRRRQGAFAFKGPGMTGPLVPGKMGKNGDQIQRLVESPADVFLVQYWGQIRESVVKQLHDLVAFKSAMTGQQLWYGIIDGNDSMRIYLAYARHFKQ